MLGLFKTLYPLILIILFCLIGPGAKAAVGAEAIPVAASIYPVADMVVQVGGRHVDVTVVVPAGASPHTFEPKPSQIRKISSSKLFFMIGAGFEIWAEKFFGAPEKESLKVVLSKDVFLIHTASHTHHKGNAHQGTLRPSRAHPERPAAEEKAANPHIRLDPVIAKSMAEKIIAALSRIDSPRRGYYQDNGRAFIAKLETLDRSIKQTVEKFSHKKYVAFHPAWDYFARRYGLVSVGIIEAAPGRSPTPQTIKKIVREIKQHRIRAIFAEPQLNPKVAEVIAGEAGVKVLLLDPIGGPHIKGRQSYLELMAYNVNILKEAMQ